MFYFDSNAIQKEPIHLMRRYTLAMNWNCAHLTFLFHVLVCVSYCVNVNMYSCETAWYTPSNINSFAQIAELTAHNEDRAFTHKATCFGLCISNLLRIIIAFTWNKMTCQKKAAFARQADRYFVAYRKHMKFVFRCWMTTISMCPKFDAVSQQHVI